MNIIVLWLLITPLFFAFGWFAGRIDMKTVIKQAKELPKRMFDSIDALIENKTGVAGNILKDIAVQEPHLIDLQISLGKLYRNRGENDIAIKLHTKLLNSQYMFSKEDKDRVRLELAQDFQKAGLIDRAETLLLKLINSDYSYKAQELLLDIYQQDKNWEEAIDTAKRLANSDYSYHTEVAQFNCELAREALIKSNNDAAFSFLATALEVNRKCVRANLILGEIHFNENNYEKAIYSWSLIEKQNYLYLPMIIDKMFEAYINLDKIKEGLTLVRGYISIYSQLNLSNIVYYKLLDFDSKNNTLNYLRSVIKKFSSSKSASQIVDLYINYDKIPQNIKSDATMIKELLVKYDDKLSFHRCNRCNFKAKSFFWQCPACYEWESINPNNIES